MEHIKLLLHDKKNVYDIKLLLHGIKNVYDNTTGKQYYFEWENTKFQLKEMLPNTPSYPCVWVPKEMHNKYRKSDTLNDLMKHITETFLPDTNIDIDKNVIGANNYGGEDDPRFNAHIKYYSPKNETSTTRPPTICDWVHWTTAMNENGHTESWDMISPVQDTPSNIFWTCGLPGAKFVHKKTGLVADVFKHPNFIQVYFSLYHTKDCCTNIGLSTWGYRYDTTPGKLHPIVTNFKKNGFWMLE